MSDAIAAVSPVLLNLALGALIPILASAWPRVVEYIQTKTHSQKLATIAQMSGAIAYKSMVAAQQKGLDYHAAEAAAIQAGVQAIQNMAIPALASLSAPTIQAAVESGLGAALAADPSVTVVKPAAASAPAPGQGANTLASLMGMANRLTGAAPVAAPIPAAPPAETLPLPALTAAAPALAPVVVTQHLAAPVAVVAPVAAPVETQVVSAPAVAEILPNVIEKPAALDAAPVS